MAKKRILILSGDQTIYQAIQYYMQEYSVDIFYTTDAFVPYKQVIKSDYCLIILEVQVSAPANLRMLGRLRNATYTPIMTISEHLSAENTITLFEAGADVCVSKPLDMDVCIAQANALIRLYDKARSNNEGILIFGEGFVINPSCRQLFINGTEIFVTRKEFDLLLFLAKHPKQVFSASQLYELIWKSNFLGNGDDTVKAHVKTLRKKMQQNGENCICNVWDIGYKFVPPDE